MRIESSLLPSIISSTEISALMAMTGDHDSSDDVQSRRTARIPVASSPWNQVVRGESEPVAAAPSSPPPPEAFPSDAVDDSGSDNGGRNNGGSVNRPAWNRPSNGAGLEVQPVMDAQSWPALSEAARAKMKSESSKGLLDIASVPQSQVWFLTHSL